MRYSGLSHRQLRIGEQVRRAVIHVLQRGELHDPLLQSVILSISVVRMSADLKIATCFVALHQNGDEVVTALNQHARYIRGQAAHTLRQIKYMPEFRFRLDTSFDNFAKIDALLRSSEVARDLDDYNKGNKE
ncbi:MAG: ribosome-binding factor A [Candidatus Tokpelaia sp. JSC188]|nr:MAG: ribosome-binding factor A [Candidatus Tokpelaia sp. JSC188]